jgi:hypothetical protein
MRIFYLPLEPYPERYTGQMREWVRAAWTAGSHALEIIEPGGITPPGSITTGVVLDAHGRSIWALRQMATLIERLRDVEPPACSDDVIYLADLFHPGYEALPYLLDQLDPHERPRIFATCWAQSIDVHDFTFAMRKWMRPYEQMVAASVQGVFVASRELADLWRAAGLGAVPHAVGLPFDADEVRRHAEVSVRPPATIHPRVFFTSRWDDEKRPDFYMDLAEMLHDPSDPEAPEFWVTSSAPSLRSNLGALVKRAQRLARAGVLRVVPGLAKRDYYRLLMTARVHFNCAAQDWISFTLLEASALGIPTLAPALRDFPGALGYDPRRLYVPWSLAHAESQLRALIAAPPSPREIAAPAVYHSATLDRMLSIME